MTDAELKKLTLTAAARFLRKREISPVELTQAVLDRITRLNDRMRAFITVTGDHALEQAKAAQERGARGRRALHGVPISLKDLYDTRGIKTTAGAKVFENRVPAEDATVVKKLSDAGTILVGKTNLHEFAFGVTTINPHFGIARNPWDPERISGGSSGGSASAISLSLGFGTLGSDTGGSIRIPAALCGVVGFKPTYGRVSLSGIVPLSWSLDHSGPMTPTVEDAAVLMEIIAGHDSRDPYSRRNAVPNYSEALTGRIRGLRVGIPKSYFFERLAPEVDSAVRGALKLLERLGARMVDIDLPSAPLQRAVFSHIASPEAYSYHEKFLEEQGEQYGADVRGRIEAGRMLLSIDYVRAQRARSIMKEECKAAFRFADVIVTPTLPIVAPRIDQTTVSVGASTEAVGPALTRFTRHFNITGLPAISVPCGFAPDGLPIGLQIVGKAFDESTVLRAAHAYEQDAGWFERRPAM